MNKNNKYLCRNLFSVSYNLDFCNTYEYPDEIIHHFQLILNNLDLNKIFSVLLIGSTSRGELTYLKNLGNISVFSDYEFIIVLKSKIRRQIEESIRNNVKRVERLIKKNPLFHIDLTLKNIKQLTKFPKTIFTFEAKTNGKIIFGEDIKPFLPNVTLENLNYKELNEILIWRLWALLIYFPTKLFFIYKKHSQLEILYKYILFKNILDITTWLLPLEGKLLSSFKSKVNYLKENYKDFKCKQFFDKEIPEFFENCLKGKLNPHKISVYYEELYIKTIELYKNALNYLRHLTPTHINNSSYTLHEWLQNTSEELFRDNALKRKIYDFSLMIRHINKKSFKQIISWYFYSKHGLILLILLNLHQSLIAFLNGKEIIAREYLENAFSKINQLILNPEEQNKINFKNYLQAWEKVRFYLLKFMAEYFIWIKYQRDHIENFLYYANKI